MRIFRWVVGIIVFLGLLLLSLQNADLVTVRFYQWFSWQTPLIFLLLIAFAFGAAAGLLAGALRSARLRRQIVRLRREHAKHLRGRPAPPADAA